jgi:hypothetical protein
MKSLLQNPEVLYFEKQIEEERQKLMKVLTENAPVIEVTLQLKKILRLSEEKKKLKPFYLSDYRQAS